MASVDRVPSILGPCKHQQPNNTALARHDKYNKNSATLLIPSHPSPLFCPLWSTRHQISQQSWLVASFRSCAVPANKSSFFIQATAEAPHQFLAAAAAAAASRVECLHTARMAGARTSVEIQAGGFAIEYRPLCPISFVFLKKKTLPKYGPWTTFFCSEQVEGKKTHYSTIVLTVSSICDTKQQFVTITNTEGRKELRGASCIQSKRTNAPDVRIVGILSMDACIHLFIYLNLPLHLPQKKKWHVNHPMNKLDPSAYLP